METDTSVLNGTIYIIIINNIRTLRIINKIFDNNKYKETLN